MSCLTPKSLIPIPTALHAMHFIAIDFLRAALLAVDDQLGTGAGRKNPELVGALAQALATRHLADAITVSAQDALVQLERIADGVRGMRYS